MHPSQIYGEPVTATAMIYAITLPPKTFVGHKIVVGPQDARSVINGRWSIPARECATFEYRSFLGLKYWTQLPSMNEGDK